MPLSCGYWICSCQSSTELIYVRLLSDDSGVTVDTAMSLESWRVTCCAVSRSPDGVTTMMRGVLWLSRWRSSLDCRGNWAPHSSQGHITTITGVTPSPSSSQEAVSVDSETPFLLCSVMWAFRLLLCENDRPQMPQTNGRSPLWIRTCRRRFDSCANDRPHNSHSNGRSPVCVRICDCSTLLSANALRHMMQTKRRRLGSSVLASWLRMCL